MDKLCVVNPKNINKSSYFTRSLKCPKILYKRNLIDVFPNLVIFVKIMPKACFETEKNVSTLSKRF